MSSFHVREVTLSPNPTENHLIFSFGISFATRMARQERYQTLSFKQER